MMTDNEPLFLSLSLNQRDSDETDCPDFSGSAFFDFDQLGNHLLDEMLDSDSEFVSSNTSSKSFSSNHSEAEESPSPLLPLPPLKPKRVRVRRNRKKLPPKSVAHLPAIRILKSDVRRRYADMVLTMLNTHDIPLMDQFLRDFCAPDFRFTEIIPQLDSPNQPPNCIDGLENIIKSWAYCFEIMPDCVFHLSEAKFIKTLGSERTRVVCKARLTGTKLYQAKNPLISREGAEYSVMQQICAVGNNLKHIHLTTTSNTTSTSSSTTSPSLEDSLHTVRSLDEVIRLSSLQQPVRVYVEGVFVFFLDQFNRFAELRNDCEIYREIDQ